MEGNPRNSDEALHTIIHSKLDGRFALPGALTLSLVGCAPLSLLAAKASLPASTSWAIADESDLSATWSSFLYVTTRCVRREDRPIVVILRSTSLTSVAWIGVSAATHSQALSVVYTAWSALADCSIGRVRTATNAPYLCLTDRNDSIVCNRDIASIGSALRNFRDLCMV
jgi:hypothetical protein